MTLRITPGPVPSDGQRIVIEDAMRSFIQGTTFTNFGPDEFVGEPVDFVYSNSEPPATNVRTRGTLWFKRGEGRLYRLVVEPVRSEVWAPSEAGANTGSETHWLAMSDRKDQLVKCRWGWAAGERVRINTTQSEWKYEVSQPIADEHRYTPICASTAGTDGGNGLGFDFDNAVFLNHAVLMDPTFIALSDASDGEYAVVVDCGFVDAFVEGPGANGTEPVLGYHLGEAGPHTRLLATNSSAATNTMARVAFVAESAASSAQQLLQVLMMPSLTNFVKPAAGATLFN